MRLTVALPLLVLLAAVFESAEDGDWELFVMSPDGSGRTSSRSTPRGIRTPAGAAARRSLSARAGTTVRHLPDEAGR
ncbi:MAG TPA: hypothetical protein VFT84_03745, partial [Gemmatimonadales bacterium]|nr:hypothetical protein [Gemmatimonadales bacterium]